MEPHLIDTLSSVDTTQGATVWGTATRLSAPHAALVNGTPVQSFELDDVHRVGVLHVGDPSQFRNGRQFAAWLGLTPMQRSSGGKTKLGGITKRGDTYLRTLLVQGARAVMHFVNRRDDRHSRWIKAVMQRRHASVAAIALANKTARIAWAILTGNESFRVA